MTGEPAGLGTGPVTQVAWVTDDLDATEAAVRAAYGGTAWTRLPDIRFGPDTCTFRGEPADFVASVSLAYSGDLQLELIAPVSGDSLYSEHLQRHGPGLHHTCVEVDDLDEAVARGAERGWACVQRGTMGGGLMDFAYLDTTGAGASYLELARVTPELRAFYATIKGERP